MLISILINDDLLQFIFRPHWVDSLKPRYTHASMQHVIVGVTCYHQCPNKTIIDCSISYPSANARPITQWGSVTYMQRLTIYLGLNNGVAPIWRQVIFQTNGELWLVYHTVTNFNEIWINGFTCSFKKIRRKMSLAIYQSYFLSLSVLINGGREKQPNVLQITFSNTLFWLKISTSLLKFSKIHYGCSVDNNPPLV